MQVMTIAFFLIMDNFKKFSNRKEKQTSQDVKGLKSNLISQERIILKSWQTLDAELSYGIEIRGVTQMRITIQDI